MSLDHRPNDVSVVGTEQLGDVKGVGAMAGFWATAGEVVCTAALPAAALAGIWALRHYRRAAAQRRPSPGRVQVDPQYVRDQFADIAGGLPDLRRPDPRLYAMYVIPPINEEQ